MILFWTRIVYVFHFFHSLLGLSGILFHVLVDYDDIALLKSVLGS